MKTGRLSTWLGALLGTILALAFSAYAHGQEFTEEFHHTYPLSANGSVSIHNVNGRVRIVGSTANEVKVDAVKRADSKQRLEEARIEVNSSADRFDLRTRYPEHDSWFGSNDHAASVEYMISVPRGSRLEASVVNSGLEISGVSGEVEAQDVNGQLTVTGLASGAHLSTVNGRAEANFSSLPPSGTIHVKSVNGNVVVVIPGGANAEVRAHTLNGGVHNDFGLTPERPRYGPGSRLEGRIGSGGPTIDLENVNGSVDIRRQ